MKNPPHTRLCRRTPVSPLAPLPPVRPTPWPVRLALSTLLLFLIGFSKIPEL